MPRRPMGNGDNDQEKSRQKRSPIGKNGEVKKKPGAKKGVMPKYIPTRPCNYTEDEVAQALMVNGGLIYETAQKLEVSPKTMFNYIHRWPGLRKVIKHAKKLKLDRAEAKLGEKIEEGDLKAIIFFLRTQGKGRGYEVHKMVSVNAKQNAPLVNIEVPSGVSGSKMLEILNKARENAGLEPMPVQGLQIGLKELAGNDNKGVVLDNTDGSSEHGTDQNPQS